MKDKILVFIPCYNCAPQITRVLNQFDKKNSSYFYEILVLDNGSKDNTVSAAIAAAKNVDNISVAIGKNQANYNLGGSHKAAFKYANANSFSHVAVLHGDDQGNINDLIPVIQRQSHHLQDACLGARFMSGSKLTGYSYFRTYGNRIFNLLFTLGTGNNIKDLGSGLNIFNTKVIENLNITQYADDLKFNVYLLLGMLEQQMKIEYFPISWREEDQISNVKMTSQAINTLQLLIESKARKKIFWEKDHRAIAHQDYKFDVVYRK